MTFNQWKSSRNLSTRLSIGFERAWKHLEGLGIQPRQIQIAMDEIFDSIMEDMDVAF